MAEKTKSFRITCSGLRGTLGYKVTSNKNSIFLPAAGWRNGSSLNDAGKIGGYWSSSLDSVESYDVYCCSFDSSGWDYRFNGHTVRPVTTLQEELKEDASKFGL